MNTDYIGECMTIVEAKKRLQDTLTQERYEHTLGVMASAEQLALIHGKNSEKAIWAGLLHDCAKEIPIETAQKLCKEGKVSIDADLFAVAPQLIHAKLGVYWAQTYYEMNDEEILCAISYHTTGSDHMTSLDKITYLADMIEPGRGEKGQALREIAEKNLDEAMIVDLNHSIKRLIQKDKFIHEDTFKARNAFWKMEQERKNI